MVTKAKVAKKSGGLTTDCRSTWRACKLSVLSSSLIPPDKKWIPGTAGGMVLSIVLTVYFATSSGDGVGTSKPAVQIQNHPACI